MIFGPIFGQFLILLNCHPVLYLDGAYCRAGGTALAAARSSGARRGGGEHNGVHLPP